MRTTTLITAISVTLLAIPTAALPPAPISKRDNLGVFVCSKTNWQPPCTHIFPTATHDNLGDCTPIPYSLSTLYLSFGPDSGLKCATYAQANCQGDRFATNYPGNGVQAAGGAQGGAISFRCLPLDAVAVIPKDKNPYDGPRRDLG